ncbi:MAG: YigZ family protein [Campylobacterota bacterium]|nr:YigZ family protein [Campylobacterota bacterium]
MFTVIEHTIETLEIKQSKFIAHLMPYAQFKEVLEQLKAEHPKARHFVTAFRYLNEYGQVVEGSSDDGEPKGTSGKPTLAVLKGHALINTAVITVRYFGGTKLGTGGLVRAYSDATNMVIDASEVVEYIKKECSVFSCDYSDMGKVDYLLEQCGISTIEKQFEPTEVQMNISAAEEQLESFYEQAKRLVRSRY